MDEYADEIAALQRSLARLRLEEAPASILEEHEVELRNLRALYRAAQQTFSAGAGDPRLPEALADLGFGEWSLDNVYSFIYEAAMDADAEGREIAAVVDGIDFTASLLAAFG